MNEIIVINLKEAFQIIWPMVISLVAGIAAIYLKNLARKVKESNGIVALEIFDNVVENVVRTINQNVIKKRIVKENRKPTLAEKTFLKEKAVKGINDIINNETKKDIKYIVDDVDQYIDNAIESKVEQLKNR